MYVIHQPDEVSFDKVGIRGKKFSVEQLSPNVEFALIETETGHATSIIEKESMFAYYVVSGSGYFEIEGQQEVCAPGDLVVIPAGKAFTYKGKMKLLLITNPPWRAEQEITL
jgi:mannose-6-phosphate isomerase-like protein (cupin superfamily)